jgi:2-polyprenyl-3-methyl-5-hydroxy-6-metoxy-1,4-benzoquinol methylase
MPIIYRKQEGTMSASYKDYGYRSSELGWAHDYLFPHLRTMLGQPHGPVLDVGCGNGAIARALIAHGFAPFGYDPFGRRLVDVTAASGNTVFVRDKVAVESRVKAAPAFRLVNGVI